MKKLAVALGLSLYLMDMGAFAALPDLTISKMSDKFFKLYNTEMAGSYDHYILHCKLSTDSGKKISFRVNQYYASFGHAEVSFDGGVIKQTGSLTATLNVSDADLVIHDIVYNGNWAKSDEITFYNDGYGTLYVKNCELTKESGSPVKVKDKQGLPSVPATVAPPTDTSVPTTPDDTKPSTVSAPPISSEVTPVGAPASDSPNPSNAPVLDSTNPA